MLALLCTKQTEQRLSGKEVTSDDWSSFDIELPIGKYVIKETTTPLGYETQDPIEIMIADADGKLTVSRYSKIIK